MPFIHFLEPMACLWQGSNVAFEKAVKESMHAGKQRVCEAMSVDYASDTKWRLRAEIVLLLLASDELDIRQQQS